MKKTKQGLLTAESGTGTTSPTKKQDGSGRSPARKKTPDKGGTVPWISGYVGVARQFLKEVKIEIKKVKWPARKELLASTAVVIFISLLMALYFALVDWGLGAIIRTILSRA